MTYSEFVDLIHLAVNGGAPTEESTVQRPEIQVYAPVALAAAYDASATQKATLARRNRIPFVAPTVFYKVENVTMAKGDDNVFRGTLSWPPLVSQMAGILAVVSDTKGNRFMIATSKASAKGLNDVLPTVWFEDKNICSFSACELECFYAPAVDCESDVTVPTPQEVTMMAVNIAKAHFFEQKNGPKDNLHNHKDDK